MESASDWSRYRNPMLIRGYNDVILGLTNPDWPWTHMNELLVPAQ